MGDSLRIFFSKKVSQCRNELKGWTFWEFSTSTLSPSIIQIVGGHFEKKISGKILTMSKKVKGGTLVSPSTVGYAEKQEQRSWFSSLCPTVQFDTIIIRRVFVELFWAVRVD